MAEVGSHLGIAPRSVARYRVRDASFPAPDGKLGVTPWWYPATIEAWQATRQGRPGRPRKTDG